MAFMNDMSVIFDGHDLTEHGFYQVVVDKNNQPYPFASAKKITTQRPIYGNRNVVTGTQREPLSFNLTFSRIDNTMDELNLRRLYSILDVATYKKLSFGEEELYYNAMPMVDSISELSLFMKLKGYVTIPFVCDAGHGWIDQQYSFSRNASTIAQPWSITNLSTAKNCFEEYRVFPWIDIRLSNTCNYVSFTLSTEAENDNWFTLYDLTPGQTISIDNENGQMISSVGQNLLNHMGGNIRLFSLEKGSNTVYHRSLEGQALETSFYDIDFYFSCPYSL